MHKFSCLHICISLLSHALVVRDELPCGISLHVRSMIAVLDLDIVLGLDIMVGTWSAAGTIATSWRSSHDRGCMWFGLFSLTPYIHACFAC